MRAISLPFTFDTDGRIASTADYKKIIQDRVVLVVMTAISERVMRPNFGTNVKGSTFENVDGSFELIKQEIEVGFSNWLPYLYILDIEGRLDQDNYLNITIHYKYGSSANAETVTIKTATLTQSGSVITEVPYGQ